MNAKLNMCNNDVSAKCWYNSSAVTKFYRVAADVVVVLFLFLLLAGCESGPDMDFVYYEGMEEFMARLHSEENWRQLSEIFSKTEDELVRFVAYITDNGLMDDMRNVSIHFFSEGEDARHRTPGAQDWSPIAFYDGEMVSGISASHVVHFLRDNPELYAVISEINLGGIIASISMRESAGEYMDIWISFTIHRKHTQFTASIYGASNSFRYIEGGNLEQRQGRRLGDGWYMIIPVPG
jgi:hypothetical protein